MPRFPVSTLLAILLAACAVGPDYSRPAMTMPAAYKEAPPGWKHALPADIVPRGSWWQVYGDAQLDGLVAALNARNPTIQIAAANYRQARAVAQEARAGFFPAISASAALSRSQQRTGSTGGSPSNSHVLSLDASWEPDLWGQVRRSVEAGTASAESKAASLAAVRLSAQAELVQNYLQLRVSERQRQLALDTVAAYQRLLKLTQNKYAVGVVTSADVAQAQALLKTAEAQAIDFDLTRRQLEHAIAILAGQVPAGFSLAESGSMPALPVVPAALPSSLLERRPDIAAAERAAAAANAQVGVQQGAYFPALTLSASGGFSSTSFASWFNTSARAWALGATLADTLFDAGARSARVDQARAAYDATVAQYRQTVLGGLQEVEDNLAALTLLADEAARQAEAVAAAREAERLALNQYGAGTADFTTVASTQASRHQSEITALQLEGRRYSASVLLIKALGGSWDGDLHPARNAGASS